MTAKTFFKFRSPVGHVNRVLSLTTWLVKITLEGTANLWTMEHNLCYINMCENNFVPVRIIFRISDNHSLSRPQIKNRSLHNHFNDFMSFEIWLAWTMITGPEILGQNFWWSSSQLWWNLFLIDNNVPMDCQDYSDHMVRMDFEHLISKIK